MPIRGCVTKPEWVQKGWKCMEAQGLPALEYFVHPTISWGANLHAWHLAKRH